MKANEAPEKIYVHVRANKELGTTWHGKKITNSDIEYTRTDAFIEKACVWLKEEQFEKNRLAACDRQTEEDAEIEREFVMSIIENEHRQPTFDDAIKYGMRLHKGQMMAKSIDAQVLENWDGKVIKYDETILDEKLSDCKVFDKVKVIIIKED